MTSASLPSLVPRAAPRGRLDPLAALLLGIAGGALLGLRRTAAARARTAATFGGLALIGAAAHRPLVEGVRRAGTRRRDAKLSLSFVVAHPVQLVFAFCRNFENFPCVIGALRQVRDFGDGRSHWCASTPSGGTVEWDAITTKYLPNSVIAWQSTGASPVEMTAVLRFAAEGESTCVRASVSYRVVDGTLADALAALATRRGEQALREDIRRLASYLDVALVPIAADV
jgi:uncharacterized membrane protein